MKKNLTISFFFLLVLLSGEKAWGQCWEEVQVTTDSFYRFNALYFTDSLNGWVGGTPDWFGTPDKLFRTTDGGKTWTPAKTSNIPLLHVFQIQFLNKDTGWVSGITPGFPYGLVKTTDGGSTWKGQQVDTSLAPDRTGGAYGLYFLDAHTGWALGKQISNNNQVCPVFRTDDGGENWIKTGGYIKCTNNPGTGDYPPSLQFISKDTGFVVTHHNAKESYYYTYDGGYTWQPKVIADTFRLSYDIKFIDRYGWLTETQNKILSTDDVKNDWVTHYVKYGALSGFMGLSFIDTLTGWASGFYKPMHPGLAFELIVKTIDGGKTWKKQLLGKAAVLQKIQFIDKKHGWAIPSTANSIDVFHIQRYNPVPPVCDADLIQPSPNSDSVVLQPVIVWREASGCVDGYLLSAGTSPGSSDIFDRLDSGVDTFLFLEHPLPPNTTIYLRIQPYLDDEVTTAACQEFSFHTEKTVSNQTVTPASPVQIYPNPAREGFWIQCAGQAGSARLKLTDAQGRIIPLSLPSEFILPDNKYWVDTQRLSSGIYYLQLQTRKQISSNKIIIVP